MMSIQNFPSDVTPEDLCCAICQEPVTSENAMVGPIRGHSPVIVCSHHLRDGRQLIAKLTDYNILQNQLAQQAPCNHR